MKLISQRSILTDAFQQIAGVVPNKTPKDILKSVLIESTGDLVTLIGTDCEIGMRVVIRDAQCEGSFRALVPVSRILETLKTCTDDSVTMDIDGTRIEIICGLSQFRLSGQDPKEFPEVGEFMAKEYLVVNAAMLRGSIRKTAFAADTEGVKTPALRGVQNEFSDGKLVLSATDGRRCAISPCAASMVGEKTTIVKPYPIVPAKAMMLVERSIGDSTVDAKICSDDSMVAYQFGAITIIAKTLTGRFPNREKFVPAKFETDIDMVCGPFLSIIRQSLVFTNPETSGVEFVFDKGILSLKSQANDVGDSDVQIPIAYDGPSLSIKLDPRYIADFLKVLDSTTMIQMKLIDKESPVVFFAGDYRYVQSPICLED